MAKFSKEEQKKQNKAVIIAILILLPVAIIIGLSLKKDKKEKTEEPKEREEITMLKESVAQYGDQAYKFPENESDYMFDYEAFTKYVDNGNGYLSISCVAQDERGQNYAITAIYTSNDKILHYLSIKDKICYDDHTTDK